MYALYVVLLLAALNRLGISKLLPQKPGAARKHVKGGGRGNGSSESGGAGRSITFADVAGVDEAKEELAEIVVGGPLGVILGVTLGATSGVT